MIYGAMPLSGLHPQAVDEAECHVDQQSVEHNCSCQARLLSGVSPFPPLPSI